MIQERVEQVIAEHRLGLRHGRVFRLLMTGLSGKQIADRLHITLKTLKHYTEETYRKCGVLSRPELFALVLGTDEIYLQTSAKAPPG